MVLVGSARAITRVTKASTYPCLMMKNQKFSSLFRHYAKRHGLPPENLEFYFTERVRVDDTPESVHLQKNDIIYVRASRQQEVPIEVPADGEFFHDMRRLLDEANGEDSHADVTFLVRSDGGGGGGGGAGGSSDGGAPCVELRAHKCILAARVERFARMFQAGDRSTGFSEANSGTVTITGHSAMCVRHMLEFVYTREVRGIERLPAAELVDLVALSDEYLMPSLKLICEAATRDVLTPDNAVSLLCAAERYNAPVMRRVTLAYIQANLDTVTQRPSFKAYLGAPDHADTLLSIFQYVAPAVSDRDGESRSDTYGGARAKRTRVSCEPVVPSVAAALEMEAAGGGAVAVAGAGAEAHAWGETGSVVAVGPGVAGDTPSPVHLLVSGASAGAGAGTGAVAGAVAADTGAELAGHTVSSTSTQTNSNSKRKRA